MRHTTAIATSLGQSDAGVFEFSFRDERYMPFEGAGVNSRWQLSLPKKVKPFDYGTISDVIVRISYTAEEDSELAQLVEGANGVLSSLTEVGVARVLSLRNDFPDAWNQLREGSAKATVEITEAHVPFFLSAFELDATHVELLVEPAKAADYPAVTFDAGKTVPPDSSGPDDGSGLWRLLRTPAEVTFIGPHVLTVDWGTEGSAVDDIMLRAVLRKASVA